ncbi:restriction endonuclease subunit S [Marinobacter sp.]|uniref:restriction endonuclease subunit S n=1 Tax=Marinobacter sp. TaxID=50741 RepID=UPI003BAA7960
MRKGWREVKLAEVTFKIGSGSTPRGGKKAYKASGLSLIRSLNVYDSYFRYENLAKIGEEQADKLANVSVEAGDVLLNITGASIARCCVVPDNVLPARVNQHVAILRPNSESLYSGYLEYLLISKEHKDRLLNLGDKGGSTRQALTKSQLQNYKISIPSLSEQKRIVAILDEAFAGIDAAIANTEKNLANARELFESFLNSVFTHGFKSAETKPLAAFCESISTGPFGSLLHKSDYVSDGVPLVNPINIVGDRVIPDHKKMIGSDTKERLKGYVLRESDVVIARRGEIGRCAVISDEQDGWICGTGCFFIRPRSSANPHFLAHLLRSANYRSELERRSSGTTMLNLSNSAISSLDISMPSIEEQIRAVDRISELKDHCRGVEIIYRQKLQALTELKQSLLQKAFKGELITNIVEKEVDEAVA